MDKTIITAAQAEQLRAMGLGHLVQTETVHYVNGAAPGTKRRVIRKKKKRQATNAVTKLVPGRNFRYARLHKGKRPIVANVYDKAKFMLETPGNENGIKFENLIAGIAAELGLKPVQVRTALAKLRVQGYIRSS